MSFIGSGFTHLVLYHSSGKAPELPKEKCISDNFGKKFLTYMLLLVINNFLLVVCWVFVVVVFVCLFCGSYVYYHGEQHT